MQLRLPIRTRVASNVKHKSCVVHRVTVGCIGGTFSFLLIYLIAAAIQTHTAELPCMNVPLNTYY